MSNETNPAVTMATPGYGERLGQAVSQMQYLSEDLRAFVVGLLEVLIHLPRAVLGDTISPHSHITRLIRQTTLPKVNQGSPVAIVTGANSGCGYETAKALMQAGYHVILACRSPEAARQAMDRLAIETDLDNMEFMALDLASLESVKQFCDQFQRRGLPLHLLVNNAGIMNTPYAQTSEGFESQFGVNHIGHFVLTMLLLDILKRSAPARIINVSSVAHLSATTVDTTRLEDVGRYSRLLNYSVGKLCNILFTKELSRRLQGTDVTVNACHPGPVGTGLYRYTLGMTRMKWLTDFLLLSPLQGALTTIYLALSPEVEQVSGEYFFDMAPHYPSPAALSEKEQKFLWNYTVEKLIPHIPLAADWK
ncbi:Retinol dehydrogenase 13 [Dispira parvispora]|uniref:Retinol dehydrogenase 13 n=1 Tax=Dispira parvispora TaxID=1520584 RepID=A0A9W8ASZ4_9FUNG|nr:Retinol dehydrogenase 13 [Dispira parvispora]